MSKAKGLRSRDDQFQLDTRFFIRTPKPEEVLRMFLTF